MQIQIGENIKKFRVEKGFTQSDLAILLSVSAQAVSRWENDQAFPDITLLPLLAKHLNISIDELMGQEGQRSKSLKKELYKRNQVITNDESENLQNELRILEIYEELGQTEVFYLGGYFQKLMCLKINKTLNIKSLEEQIVKARQTIRTRLRTSNMSDRIFLLGTVASYEEEDKLELWADEYALPEYIKSNIWDELMLSRYMKENNIDKVNRQSQKILYKQIENAVFYLTDSIFNVKEKEEGFNDPARYKMALDMLSLYSMHIDDIFIYDRIVAEERYGWALLYTGRVEESLAVFSQISEHLSILYHLPEGCVLHGSVPFLKTVHIVIDADDKLKCAMNLGGYEKEPLFDKIRDDERFIEYMESLNKFFPQKKCRSWVNEKGDSMLDLQWEILLNRARIEANKLSDGNVVVMLTAKGSVVCIPFQNLISSIDDNGVVKVLIEIKKNEDAKIDRIICMWHDGSIDLPSFAFREALLSVNDTNLSTKMLLNGSTGYIVKTIRATMPKEYQT